MTRRYKRSRWPEVTAVVGIAVLSIVVLFGDPGGRGGPEDVIDSEPPPVRDFEGTVVGGGEPLAGVKLELFEGSFGPVGKATSSADGTYSIRWTPATTLDAGKLVLSGTDPRSRFADTAAPWNSEFVMREPVAVRGMVVGTDGKRIPSVAVQLAVHGKILGQKVADDLGEFEIPDMPRGAEMQAFAYGDGYVPRVFRGFHVGDFLVLHLLRGKEVEVAVQSPDGGEVPNAWVRVSVAEPFRSQGRPVLVKDGVARITAATHASGLVEVFTLDHDHIPVFVDASTYGRTEAVIWPSRSVELRVWDGWANRGVLGIETEINLSDDSENGSWNGRDAARTWREFPLYYGMNRGSYRIALPRTAVKLALEASGYANARVKVPASEDRILVRMPPLQKRKTAILKVRAPELQDDHWMVVADDEERWYAAFLVSGGEGRVRVPARRPLELASAGAAGGRWLSRVNIKPIEPNRTRVVKDPALRDAAELILKLDPPVTATVTVVDETYGKAVPPLRRTVDGETKFWVRAAREVRVTVEPDENFHARTEKLEVGLPRSEWNVFLRPAAGFTLRVRDPEGRPVPGADVSVWEPLRGGRVNLRGQPNRYRTDATGSLTVTGLRNGPTPIEIRSDGFRLMRPRALELENGKVVDGGTIALAPAGILRGIVVDPEGKPLSGVRLRTAGRGLRRLELPGGGARDLYDVTGGEEWDAITDEQGAFFLRDATHRLPLAVCEHPDYAITVAEVTGPSLRVQMKRKAELAVVLPSGSPVDGVYVLLSKTRAIRVHALGGMSLNPLPLTLPVGRTELFLRLRNRRWAAPILELKEGDQRVSIEKFQRD